MFVISGVSETRYSRGVRVFTRPEAAEYDAGQAFPPENKTNIQPWPSHYPYDSVDLSEWRWDVWDVLPT